MACSLKLACVLVLFMVAMTAPITQAIVCAQVKTKLGECYPYLQGDASVSVQPTPGCCRALLELRTEINSDHHGFCSCARDQIGKGAMAHMDDLPHRCKQILGIYLDVTLGCHLEA